MKRSIFFLAAALSLTCEAREWTASDGRKLQADFVSVSAGQVTLKRASDGQTFVLPLSRLSAADQTFVTQQSAAPSAPATAPAAASLPAKPVEGPFAPLVTGDWALSDHKGLPFALYASKDLNAAQKYPLILALHGRSQNDENGKQVGGWMKSFLTPDRYAKHPCIIVAPLGYQPYGGTGSAWNDKPGTQAIALVKELLKSLPIDKDRVYCIGYSMGGFGTCHLINTEPRLFAAGIAVAGCTGPDTANTFKKVPVWLFHATDDATVEVKYSRDLAKALERAKECKYTEYPTGGHGIAGKVFEEPELHEWLFAKGTKK